MKRLEPEAGVKELLKITWPIFIEYLMTILVTNVNQIMISKYSQDSVAAIGNANQLLNLVTLTFTMVNLGTAILAAQYIGAGKSGKMGEIYTLAVMVNSALGAAVSVCLVVFARQAAEFMKIDAALYADFQTYLSAVGGALFLQAIFTTFASIFRSKSLMREVTLLSILTGAVTITFNLPLIYGIGPFKGLGVLGAAIATDLGRLAGVILIIIMYYRRIGISLSIRQLKPFPFKSLKKMLTIGVPAGGESVSYTLTSLVIMLMINGFGLISVNAKIFASMFVSFSSQFASAVSQAAQIRIGYSIGAKDYEKAKEQKRATLNMALASSLIVASVIALLSRPLFRIVTDNKEIIALGATILLIDIIVEAGRSVNLTMVRSLQAAGDIKFPILLGIASTWAVAVGMSYILGVRLEMGLVGVWIAMGADECLRAVICLFRWKGGRWKNKKLI